ncbi:MAG: hypothetical protein Ta2E_12030 [Mycoplasmoidaceae bacterium]|nr:MAG: hypothetical protein Ta2E_12030 [Mycoplasmoidaceae bacterium]
MKTVFMSRPMSVVRFIKRQERYYDLLSKPEKPLKAYSSKKGRKRKKKKKEIFLSQYEKQERIQAILHKYNNCSLIPVKPLSSDSWIVNTHNKFDVLLEDLEEEDQGADRIEELLNNWDGSERTLEIISQIMIGFMMGSFTLNILRDIPSKLYCWWFSIDKNLIMWRNEERRLSFEDRWKRIKTDFGAKLYDLNKLIKKACKWNTKIIVSWMELNPDDDILNETIKSVKTATIQEKPRIYWFKKHNSQKTKNYAPFQNEAETNNFKFLSVIKFLNK